MRKRSNNGGRMANMLRAMDAFVARDSGGVEEAAQEVDRRCFDCGYMDCDDTGHSGRWTFRDDEDGHEITCNCDCHEPAPVTCHTCGAVVEDDALARQTMADGSLMWPQPFCRACLLAGLRRLKAWLAAGGAGAMGEDGDA